jgi:hypothetical protein
MSLRRLRCLAALAAVTVAVGCAAAPRQRAREMGPVDTGAGSLTEARKYLEGRWSLVSFEVYPPGGAPVRLTGQGTLVYDNFGNLQMDLRPDEKAAALLERAGVTTRQGVVSTSGRVVVDVPGRKLTYVLEGQPAGNGGPLSMERPRYWQVEENVLTLTTRDAAGKPLSVGVWRKQG